MVRRWIAAGALGALTLPGLASANPFSSARYRGLMGTSVDVSGWATFWNPAALPLLEGGRISLHAGGVWRQADYDRYVEENGETEETAPFNAGVGMTRAQGVVPSVSGGYGFDLNEDFAMGVGAAFYIARAGLANWTRTPGADVEHPGALDGPARWGTISTEMVILSPAAAIGFHHKPSGISIGGGPVYNIVSLDLTKARNLDKSTALRDEDGRLVEGRILLEDGEAQTLTWVAGLRWDVDESLAFAFTWHQGANHEVEGNSFIQFGTAEETSTRAGFPLQVADHLRLGAQMQATDWLAIRSEIEWANWSRMDAQDAINIADPERPTLMEIERNFEDTLAGRIRGDFMVSESVDLHAGFEYETGATPTNTHEPGLAESDNWQLGVGISVDLSESLMLTSSFIWHQYADVEVLDSIQAPTMNGYYTDQRQYLTVDLEIKL
jgi:opacity protein-like surface antigen